MPSGSLEPMRHVPIHWSSVLVGLKWEITGIAQTKNIAMQQNRNVGLCESSFQYEMSESKPSTKKIPARMRKMIEIALGVMSAPWWESGGANAPLFRPGLPFRRPGSLQQPDHSW